VLGEEGLREAEAYVPKVSPESSVDPLWPWFRVVWKGFRHQAKNYRRRFGVGLKIQLMVRSKCEMGTGFVCAPDEFGEDVVVGLSQSFNLDKLPPHIRCFDIIGHYCPA